MHLARRSDGRGAHKLDPSLSIRKQHQEVKKDDCYNFVKLILELELGFLRGP